MSYDNDLDELGQILRSSPKSKTQSATRVEKEQPKRDVKITFGLDIEKEEADDHLASMEEALDCAVENGVFGFLKKTPALEVYPRVWCPSA